MLRALGRGAMGVVYEAHDPEIDRKVAIKLVRANLLEGDERAEFLARFRREAQAAGRCSHPSIVAIYDFAMHEGNPFLAMEYVDGLSLDRAMASGQRLPTAGAVHIVVQTLEALDYAHARGIVHRDIKPANILLMSGGRVKVTDFGVARIDTVELTHVGMAIGTPSYMSPEQFRGDAVDARSDLFAVGVVLAELLSGKRPFHGRGFTEIAGAVATQSPEGLPELATSVGAAMVAVIERALAKRPEDRFPSAATMAQALRDAASQHLSPAGAEEAIGEIDRTLVAGRSREIAASHPGPLDPTLLSDIERRLARHLGPIARYLVQNEARTAHSPEALCESLAQRIDRQDERRSFLEEALEAVREENSRKGSRIASDRHTDARAAPSSVVRANAAAIGDKEIDRAQRALAETHGPIAKILVQRALADARSAEELWERLAAQIPDSAQRDTFLRERERE